VKTPALANHDLTCSSIPSGMALPLCSGTSASRPICAPGTRSTAHLPHGPKIDPAGIDMVRMRYDIAAIMGGIAPQPIVIPAAQAQATVAQQNAMGHQADLNLSYTTITAPVDGTVGVRTLRVGEYVRPGTQLMAGVPLQAVYITANYKETELTDMRPGQPVTIAIDTFPGVGPRPCR
jgi:hypothetical protein